MNEPTRVYRNANIAVEWRPERCVHCEACVRGLPAVFDTAKRPWVNIDGASPEAIRAQVAECPDGALSIENPDIVQNRQNGPSDAC